VPSGFHSKTVEQSFRVFGNDGTTVLSSRINPARDGTIRKTNRRDRRLSDRSQSRFA
jgi:hypothetical protein